MLYIYGLIQDKQYLFSTSRFKHLLNTSIYGFVRNIYSCIGVLGIKLFEFPFEQQYIFPPHLGGKVEPPHHQQNNGDTDDPAGK